MASSPRASSSQPCKLFIGGLSYDTTDASLYKYFSKFGQVASAVVLRDPATTRSRGFGFVTYCTMKAANNAIACKQHSVDGRKVEAKFAVPRNSGPLKTATSTGTNNANSSQAATSNGYSSENISANQQATNNNGQEAQATTTTSFNYKQAAQAGAARSSSIGSSDIGSPMPVSKTKSRTSPASPKGGSAVSVSSQSSDANGIIMNKIFVGGLLYATGHDSMRKYFEQFGPVENAEVIYNRDTKKSRGFGFVVFQDSEAVQKVIDAQQDHILVIDNKQVEVKQCVARQESTGSSSSQPQHATNPIAQKTSSSSAGTGSTQPSSVPQVQQPVQNKWKENTLTFNETSTTGTNNISPAASFPSPRRSVSVVSGTAAPGTPTSSQQPNNQHAGESLTRMTNRSSTSSNDSNSSDISSLNNYSDTLAPPTASADPVLPSSRTNRNHIPEPIGSPLHAGGNRRRFFSQHEPAVGLHRASSAPSMNPSLPNNTSGDWELGGLQNSLHGLRLESPVARSMSGSLSIEGFGSHRLSFDLQNNQSVGDLNVSEQYLSDLGPPPQDSVGNHSGSRHPRAESVASSVSAGGLFDLDFSTSSSNQQLPLPPLSLPSPTGNSNSPFYQSSQAPGAGTSNSNHMSGGGNNNSAINSPFRQAVNNQVSRNQFQDQQYARRPSPLHTASSFTLGSRTPERSSLNNSQTRSRHGSFVGSSYNPLDFSPRASSQSLGGSPLPSYWEPTFQQPLPHSNLARDHQRSLTSSFSSDNDASSRDLTPSALMSSSSSPPPSMQQSNNSKGSLAGGMQRAFRSESLNNENANAGWSNFSSGFGGALGGLSGNNSERHSGMDGAGHDPRVESVSSDNVSDQRSQQPGSLPHHDQRPLFSGF